MKLKKTVLAICVILALLVNSVVFAVDNKNNAENSYWLDTVVFADDNTHNVSADSNSGIKTLTTMRIGEFTDEKYTVRRLAAKKGIISFDIAVSENLPLTLEFEEIHNKSFNDYGYYVNVEGTDVFLRAGRETSAGPTHYFITVPEELTKNKTKVRVTLKNISDFPVNISRVWGHSNIEGLFLSEGIDHKITVMMFDGNIMKGGRKSKEEMRELMLEYKESFGSNSSYDFYNIGLSSEIFIMQLPEEQVYEAIDNAIDLSRELDIPFALNLCSWWSGTPKSVPDGKGGFFTDLEYQELTYDPENSGKRGTYQTTTPNSWANTPWLTLNDDYLNQVRAEKYVKYSKYISMKLAESKLKSEDGKIPEFSVFVENEPQYWTHRVFFPTTPDSVSDVSQKVVDYFDEKYGVTLDPTDGMDEDEKKAMFYNLNDYMKIIMDAAAEGAGNDYIIVNNGTVLLPESQLMDNYYTHQYDDNASERIYAPDGWDTFETAFTKNGNNGIEGYGRGGYIGHNINNYVAARGKYAVVNLEEGGISTWDPVNEYAIGGAAFCTLFNTDVADQPKLAAADANGDNEVEEPFFGKKLFSYTFDDVAKLVTDKNFIGYDGLGESEYMSWRMVAPNNNECEGDLTFKVDNKNKPLTNGLHIYVKGIVRTAQDSNCYMEIYAGNSPDNLTLAHTVDYLWNQGKDIDLSEYIDKTSSTAYFKIVMHNSTGHRNYSSLRSVAAYEPFAEVLGHTNGFNYSYKQTRKNNIVVTLRRDVEDMLAEQKEYCADNADYKKAEVLYHQGKYSSAKELLLGTASLNKLPAKFMVVDKGKLDNYPVFADVVDNEVPVSIILNEIGKTVRFEVSSETDTDVKLTFSGLNGRYSLIEKNSEYILEKNDVGELLATDNKITVSLSVGKDERKFPEKFTGYMSVSSYQSADKIFVGSHNPEIGDYSQGRYFKLSDEAVIKRGEFGTDYEHMEIYPREKLNEIPFGERAEVTLNDKGEVSELLLLYSMVSGKITKVIEAQFPEMTSPFIEVLDDKTQQTYRFKLNSQTEFETSKVRGSSFNALYPGAGLGFKVGNEVNVVYMSTKAGNEDFYYATKVFEEYITVIDEDLNDNSYEKSIFSQKSVKVSVLDSNTTNVIGLSGVDGGGSVIWKIESDKPIKEVSVNYSGRSILGSTVRLHASANGFIFTEFADMMDVFTYTYNQLFSAYCDDKAVVGGNTIYVKAELDTKAGTTWGFLNSIQIQIKV